MKWNHNRALSALTPALVLCCAASSLGGQPAILLEQTADHVVQISAPDGEATGVNHLMTNVPSSFSGGDLNEILGADVFYSHGVTGSGATVANVESGHIWNGHETLGHVSTFANSPAAWNDPGTVGEQQQDLVDRHATWVAMTIGGRVEASGGGEHQRGIAYGANLVSGSIASVWNGDAYATGFNFNRDSFFTPYNAYFGAADVINSSWGGFDPEGDGFYTTLGDALANENPSTTWVTSAGNEGAEANKVGFPGAGYNSITVAALNNGGANQYDTIASFSSRGPQDWAGGGLRCDDCRSPVDIAAPGTNITTAFYGGATGGNNPTLSGSSPSGSQSSYTTSIGGTSFSSPIVAGAATLIADASYATPGLAGNPDSRDARVVKAVLMNSAAKIPGWDNGQALVGGVIQTHQSLDYASGAGSLDIGASYEQYVEAITRDVPGEPLGPQGSVGLVGWDFGEVIEGLDNVYEVASYVPKGASVTVTLSWFRERMETYLQTRTAQDIAQVDLDLIVRDASTDIVVAQSVSHLNVSEHLHFTAPEAAWYTIEVNFFDEVFGTLASEQYGLAWKIAVPEPAAGALLVAALLGVFGPCWQARGRRSARGTISGRGAPKRPFSV